MIRRNSSLSFSSAARWSIFLQSKTICKEAHLETWTEFRTTQIRFAQKCHFCLFRMQRFWNCRTFNQFTSHFARMKCYVGSPSNLRVTTQNSPVHNTTAPGFTWTATTSGCCRGTVEGRNDCRPDCNLQRAWLGSESSSCGDWWSTIGKSAWLFQQPAIARNWAVCDIWKKASA